MAPTFPSDYKDVLPAMVSAALSAIFVVVFLIMLVVAGALVATRGARVRHNTPAGGIPPIPPMLRSLGVSVAEEYSKILGNETLEQRVENGL